MGSAVTFDFHNTLVRCDAWFDLEVRYLPVRVGDEMGLSSPADLVETYRALRREIITHGEEMDAVDGVVETWRRAGVAIDPAEVAPVVDQLMQELVPSSVLLEGVRETLASVVATGIPIGIVSSAVHHQFLEWCLTWHGVRDYFADVVTSALVGYYKSRPEIYTIALQRLNADRTRTIHIGDSFRFDHLTGSSLGIRTVWLNESMQPAPPDQPKPDVEIARMADAPAAIHALLAEIGTLEGRRDAD